MRIDLAQAVGRLELLWHFTAEFAPQGDIGKFSDKRIEVAMDWRRGKPGRLLAALIECGWIDRHPECRLCVHDWQDHADQAVRKRLSRAGLKFVVTTRSLRGDDVVTTRSLRGDDMVQKTSPKDVGVSGKVTGPPEPEPHPRPVTPPTPPPSLWASDDAQVDVGSVLAKTPQSTEGDHAHWFDLWWSAYWRKVAKKPALQAFKKNVKTRDRFEEVMAATKAQTPVMMQRDPEKRPHAATWLNQERWADLPSQPRRGPSKSPTVDELAESIEAFRRTK